MFINVYKVCFNWLKAMEKKSPLIKVLKQLSNIWGKYVHAWPTMEEQADTTSTRAFGNISEAIFDRIESLHGIRPAVFQRCLPTTGHRVFPLETLESCVRIISKTQDVANGH